jgi:predicted HTH transcriptional regulator
LLTQMPLLSQKIIGLVTSRGKITVGELNTLLEDDSRPTIKKHLEKLVKINQLTKHGNGKGTYYTK